MAQPAKELPPPVPRVRAPILVQPWPLLAALAIGFVMGICAGVPAGGWYAEHETAGLRQSEGLARGSESALRQAITLITASAGAALDACSAAMPPSVAAQRQAMIEELKRQNNAPTGVGGPAK